MNLGKTILKLSSHLDASNPVASMSAKKPASPKPPKMPERFSPEAGDPGLDPKFNFWRGKIPDEHKPPEVKPPAPPKETPMPKAASLGLMLMKRAADWRPVGRLAKSIDEKQRAAVLASGRGALDAAKSTGSAILQGNQQFADWQQRIPGRAVGAAGEFAAGFTGSEAYANPAGAVMGSGAAPSAPAARATTPAPLAVPATAAASMSAPIPKAPAAKPEAAPASKGTPESIKPSTPAAQPLGAGDYTAARGDTLGAMSKRLGMSPTEFLAYNPQMTDPNKVEVGQKFMTREGAKGTSDYSKFDFAGAGQRMQSARQNWAGRNPTTPGVATGTPTTPETQQQAFGTSSPNWLQPQQPAPNMTSATTGKPVFGGAPQSNENLFGLSRVNPPTASPAAPRPTFKMGSEIESIIAKVAAFETGSMQSPAQSFGAQKPNPMASSAEGVQMDNRASAGNPYASSFPAGPYGSQISQTAPGSGLTDNKTPKPSTIDVGGFKPNQATTTV